MSARLTAKTIWQSIHDIRQQIDDFGLLNQQLAHELLDLRGLTATAAATVQLSVPVIAAFGGVLLLSEAVTPRLVVASAATLGGVALVLTQRNRARS